MKFLKRSFHFIPKWPKPTRRNCTYLSHKFSKMFTFRASNRHWLGLFLVFLHYFTSFIVLLSFFGSLQKFQYNFFLKEVNATGVNSTAAVYCALESFLHAMMRRWIKFKFNKPQQINFKLITIVSDTSCPGKITWSLPNCIWC